MPKPEHVAALAQLVTHALVASPTAPKAAEALYAALATEAVVQDAVLAALVESGRLVEERRQPCSCGSESVGPLRIGHLLADAHTSLRERARYVTHWREVPDAD